MNELSENSNIQLNEIFENRLHGDGNFADFALNFHRNLDKNDEEFEELCQFPMLLTYSKDDQMARIEFDENFIPLKTVERVKKEILDMICSSSEVNFVEVFQRFLKNTKVNEETDFFLNGGHSLIAMQLIDYLSDLLEIEIPLKLIFDCRTPKLLKEAVNQLKRGVIYEVSDERNESNSVNETGEIHEEKVQRGSSKTQKPDHLRFVFPLSRQQNQMFYLSLLTENSLEYQLSFIQPFPSTVSPSEIHCSLLMTIQEQSIFRAVFRLNSENGEPNQEVVSMTESFIRFHVEEVLNEEDLHKRIRELCEESIDVLSGYPLLKASFVTSPSKNVAFLHLHHLISDARSTQLTNSTMKKFFENSQKTPKRLEFTYMDYCLSEKTEENFKVEEEYLNTLIEGLGRMNVLKNKISSPEKVSIDVPKEVISMKMRIGEVGETPFSIFLKLISNAFIEVFPSISSFNIAFPSLNRNQKTSEICGYFLNNLVINSSYLSSLPSILNSNLPYSDVIREVRRSSGIDENIADVYINCRYDLEFDESNDDVLLDLVPLKLHFPIEFDIDLLANKTYRITMRSDRFAGEKMMNILMKLKNNLGIEREKQERKTKRVLYGQRKDIPCYSVPHLFHHFFNSNITANFGNKSSSSSKESIFWNYGQTYKRILQLSWNLTRDFLISRASSIRSDDIISVIGSKSIETTVRCLAVQFAGASYLPIDKGYPKERQKTILNDSLFTIGEFIEESRPLPRHYRRFCISTPFCLSYIITTSGTTGHPKSVSIGSDSVSNLCLLSTLSMKTSSSSRVFQFTNFVFDNSVLEVMMTISSQATLIYGSSTFDPSELEKLIENYGITHCLLFPSLVQSFDINKIKKLNYWIVGGERLSQNLLNSSLELGLRVIQNYGPTETTAFAIAKSMRKGDDGCQIGYPTINSKLRIESKESEDSGELLIQGTGIMRGYLNRKISESFKIIDGKNGIQVVIFVESEWIQKLISLEELILRSKYVDSVSNYLKLKVSLNLIEILSIAKQFLNQNLNKFMYFTQ
uniref:Carrier domain-containing protein n=1 Tax=Caenorhabditis tropicalis TaxID=1561998 RepID=A0A1I7T3B2_9PELO